jgi:hypothetical protein
MIDRLYRNWTYGGFLAGILLLVLTPVFAASWPVALLAIFLHLPAYMLHQYEEHDANRFADYMNRTVGQGVEALTPPVVFLVNIPGVWGINALSIWLAATVSLGYGLIGVYLTLVNALVHIGPSVRLRSYNPGLATAIVLFLPLSVWSLIAVQATREASVWHHALGLGAAILIHAVLMLHVVSRRRRLQMRTS